VTGAEEVTGAGEVTGAEEVTGAGNQKKNLDYFLQSSVLNPPSSILCPQSSVLNPPSSILCPQLIGAPFPGTAASLPVAEG